MDISFLISILQRTASMERVVLLQVSTQNQATKLIPLFRLLQSSDDHMLYVSFSISFWRRQVLIREINIVHMFHPFHT